jgi:periplasmic copper chaperone A
MRPYLPRSPVTDMAALYFTVRNTGPGADHLDRIELPALSSDATMHTVRNHTMVRVRGYRVPPHGTLVLRRGGNHVMLTDLKQMPKAGGSVLARLFFRHTGEIDVDIPVVPQTYVPSSP